MIEINRTRQTAAAPKIKVLALGGAGASILDQLLHDGIESADCIALNTDTQALGNSAAQTRVQLGTTATRGLGAGGDPDTGYASAEESSDAIKASLDGAEMVFLCAGLGGGTGSGAAPLVAHLARKAGAVVVAFVTLPFAFEGKRRSEQATTALEQLEEQADIVVCFENDRMSQATDDSGDVQHAFLVADQIVSQSIRAVTGIAQRQGLIAIGLDNLAAVLRRQQSRCLFGYGEGDGPQRVHEALDQALTSPLMQRGESLADSHSVLVQISGGTELTLREITAAMEDFNRYVSDSALVHFGVRTDPQLGDRLSISILGSTGLPVAKAAPSSRPALSRKPEPEPLFDDDGEPEPFETLDTPAQTPAPKPKPRPAPVYAKIPVITPPLRKEEKAEQMTLEPASRGRFDKGEPTIVNGEDLDVPTFLRKGPRNK